MEQALWTRARLGSCGPRLDLLTARFDKHVYALILVGSVLATAAGPAKTGGPVTWSTRQTSRADGRVESL